MLIDLNYAIELFYIIFIMKSIAFYYTKISNFHFTFPFNKQIYKPKYSFITIYILQLFTRYYINRNRYLKNNKSRLEAISGFLRCG